MTRELVSTIYEALVVRSRREGERVRALGESIGTLLADKSEGEKRKGSLGQDLELKGEVKARLCKALESL